MTAEKQPTSEPSVYSEAMQHRLSELMDYARNHVEHVNEPRFQALLETTAEVLTGLRTAFHHYDEKKDPVWRGTVPINR